jgi:hypothetical protein
VLKKLAADLWVSDSNQTAFGLDIGTRMTVVRLATGLFVHSPIQVEAQILNALGEVKWVVIPNKWRRANVAAFKTLFPQARFYGAPDLEKIEKAAEIKPITENVADYSWSRELDHLLIRGSPFFNEVVFFHRASKTLILGDLAGYMYDSGPLTAQLAMRLLKSKDRVGWTDQEKKLYIRNKKEFDESIAKMMQWNFNRVIIAHGKVLEKTSSQELAQFI